MGTNKLITTKAILDVIFFWIWYFSRTMLFCSNTFEFENKTIYSWLSMGYNT